MSSFKAYIPPPPEEVRGGAAQPLLIAQNLRKYFPVRGGLLNRVTAEVKAVDDVSFEVRKGEVLGIVGESGCGKSTTARLVMQLIVPDEGTLVYDGDPVGHMRGISVAALRKQVQMVFQESFRLAQSAADCRRIRSPMRRACTACPRADADERTQRLLREVGLNPTQYMRRYPHELSGGQRQRVNIARALALQPKLLILDESVSALDKSIEAQVLNLLVELKGKFDLTYMFISHDLNVVEFISDHVMVMYLGKVVETGPVEEIYRNARHPYTRALLKSKPSFDPAKRTREMPLTGDPPSPLNPPSGCRFRTRCGFAQEVCAAAEPPLVATPDSPAAPPVACHMFKAGSGHSQAIRERPMLQAEAHAPHVAAMEAPAVQLENLTVEFVRRDRQVKAVNGVSLTLKRGEILTILGESGSGKSVTLRALMGLMPDYAPPQRQGLGDGARRRGDDARRARRHPRTGRSR